MAVNSESKLLLINNFAQLASEFLRSSLRAPTAFLNLNLFGDSTTATIIPSPGHPGGKAEAVDARHAFAWV